MEDEKMDEVMLPGFRFHPTDEELVGFYLRRKIQQRPLSIELIKQVDIYKYDPWDLPKLASTGEKEWYFYCPRDRKYRNSARPNRVTGAGFWKATGTDRPIYSSECSKCIGLKKSLVFYKGRAAKGIKTDWMMHEFRLPSITDSKRFVEKSIPPNDSWAICRIFKKPNSTAQRALSHSWVSRLPETTASDMLTQQAHSPSQFSSTITDNISLTTKINSTTQFGYNRDLQHSYLTSFSPLDVHPYKPINKFTGNPSQVSISKGDLPESGHTFSSPETSEKGQSCAEDSSYDVSSFMLNMSSSIFGDIGKASESIDYRELQDQYNCFITPTPEMQGNLQCHGEETTFANDNETNMTQFADQWGALRSVGFPLGLPLSMPDAWKSNLLWDSSPCPTQMSTNYSTCNFS
ncbi:unnamed protein product [Ilex paraguariensis]|uniref:NAC domain-containing protein n=1 Tax=Ilex paraguariensis TaxID=185542 RepID=A0ABC8QUR8_9AQUA